MARVNFNGRFPASLNEWASDVEQAIDRYFVRPMQEATGSDVDSFAPALDVYECDKGYQVSVDLPGVQEKDLSLEVHEDRLTISGKRQRPNMPEGFRSHRQERLVGNFQRTLTLPQSVDTEAVGAEFKNGVLVIDLPKSPKNRPVKIQINTGDSGEQPES